MKVLITGATGLIGKEVGKLLAEAGHEISVVSRHPERASQELPFPAHVYPWKSHEAPFPIEALDGQEAIIHLAGEPVAGGRWTEERKKRIRDSRVVGTRKIVEAVRSSPRALSTLKAFISGSAIGIYGDRGDEVLNEETPVGEGFLADVVREWESEARKIEAVGPIRLCVVRTGIVLSRRGGALEKMLPVFTRGLGGKLGRGQQWMSWIHITDIAKLFVFMLENEKAHGVYNGVAPEAARNDRFTIELARSVGRPVFLPVPEAALKTALGEMATALLGSQRVRPERAMELGFRFEHGELIEALRELGEPLKGGQHELVAEQWVPRKPDEIFSFFCRETNLEEITPQFLNFHIIGKSTEEIGEGTLIDYKLKLHGVPMKWRTRIEEWVPNRKFVDVQLSGPYKKWHHTHEFIPFAGGTLMRDRVLFRLPFGWAGDAAAGWKVSRDVASIFAYRREKIGEMFT